MESHHKKREELRRRIDNAPGRAGFDAELGREIAAYALHRRSMRPSWEEIAKELTTASWLLKDCVVRSAKAKAKAKAAKQGKRGKRRRKGAKTILVRIVLDCQGGQLLRDCAGCRPAVTADRKAGVR